MLEPPWLMKDAVALCAAAFCQQTLNRETPELCLLSFFERSELLDMLQQSANLLIAVCLESCSMLLQQAYCNKS